MGLTLELIATHGIGMASRNKRHGAVAIFGSSFLLLIAFPGKLTNHIASAHLLPLQLWRPARLPIKAYLSRPAASRRARAAPVHGSGAVD